MAKDQQDPPEDQQDPPEDQQDPPEDQQDPPEDQKDPPEDQKDSGKKDQDPEVKKAIRRRDAAVAARQKAEEEVRRLKEKYEPEKADPVKVANRRLVTAESRVVMAAAGLTDVEAQKKLTPFLDLDSVSVDEDGTVDSDTIQERLETLVELVGKLGKKAQPRVPKVNPTDRSGDRAAPKDAAAARRQAMLLGR